MIVPHDSRITALFGIELPVVQAPMAGASTPEMAVAVSEAGGLGSLPSAQYDEAGLRAALQSVRAGTRRPFNLNFFCHEAAGSDPARQMRWRARLAPYYVEAGLDPAAPVAAAGRTPFDDALCAVVEEARPVVVSFHFGLPPAPLLERVKRTGARVLASATTVAEARWLVERGVDAVIAQGYEAGGHRGHFLDHDIHRQPGTFALVPQVVDAVDVPVVAAGGVADRRGVAAAFALGAAAVQVGTAYLLTPEAGIPAVHREALAGAGDDSTAVTNVFTGRPARTVVNRVVREVGPLSEAAPAFPTAGAALAPLRRVHEERGSCDFSPLWSGQAAALARPMSAAALTRWLVEAD